MEGAHFKVELFKDYVLKYPKNEDVLERAYRIHQDLKDISEIIPVELVGNALKQARAQGEILEGDTWIGKPEYDEWLKDYERRVRDKGYEPKGVGTMGNLYYFEGKFQVVDIEQYKEIK